MAYKASLIGILMNGRILIVGKVFQSSNGFFQELWRFSMVRKLILNAIVVNVMILSQMILRVLKKKNALVKKVLT